MKPFPWKCRTCKEFAVEPAVIPSYEADLEYDGRVYHVVVPDLNVRRCTRCQAIQLDDAADERITTALRNAARLLPPTRIIEKREALGLTRRELAECLDVPEAVVSRWESGDQLQQRAVDILLRAFFEVPELRRYLRDRESIDRTQTNGVKTSTPAVLDAATASPL